MNRKNSQVSLEELSYLLKPYTQQNVEIINHLTQKVAIRVDI